MLGAAQDAGWTPLDLTHSPILGPKGNVEFFVWWKLAEGPGDAPRQPDRPRVSRVVQEAHETLFARDHSS